MPREFSKIPARLFGFISDEADVDEAVLESGVVEIQEQYRGKLIAMSTGRTKVDMSFAKICAKLRVPNILLESDERFEEDALAGALREIALARYRVPFLSAVQQMIELVDVFTVSAKNEPKSAFTDFNEDIVCLGLPLMLIRPLGETSTWCVPPDPYRPARNGFETRDDLISYLDQKFPDQGH